VRPVVRTLLAICPIGTGGCIRRGKALGSKLNHSRGYSTKDTNKWNCRLESLWRCVCFLLRSQVGPCRFCLFVKLKCVTVWAYSLHPSGWMCIIYMSGIWTTEIVQYACMSLQITWSRKKQWHAVSVRYVDRVGKTTNSHKLHYQLPRSCTMFFCVYDTKLQVSAIYPGHLQGVTNLVDVCSVYGVMS
jgi:hypothetical protein